MMNQANVAMSHQTQNNKLMGNNASNTGMIGNSSVGSGGGGSGVLGPGSVGTGSNSGSTLGVGCMMSTNQSTNIGHHPSPSNVFAGHVSSPASVQSIPMHPSPIGRSGVGSVAAPSPSQVSLNTPASPGHAATPGGPVSSSNRSGSSITPTNVSGSTSMGNNTGQAESFERSVDRAYMEKLADMRKYIEPLTNLIKQLEGDERKARELDRIKNLFGILTNSRRATLDFLEKCEKALEKMDKEKKFSSQKARHPMTAQMSASSSSVMSKGMQGQMVPGVNNMQTSVNAHGCCGPYGTTMNQGIKMANDQTMTIPNHMATHTNSGVPTMMNSTIPTTMVSSGMSNIQSSNVQSTIGLAKSSLTSSSLAIPGTTTTMTTTTSMTTMTTTTTGTIGSRDKDDTKSSANNKITDICKPLIDTILRLYDRPMFNHTMARTIGPTLSVLHHDPFNPRNRVNMNGNHVEYANTMIVKKRKRTEIDSSLLTNGLYRLLPMNGTNVVNETLQGEIARLDTRYTVRPLVFNKHVANTRSQCIMCKMDDLSMPCVPPLTVYISEEYPDVSPHCQLNEYEYDTSEFFKLLYKVLRRNLDTMQSCFTLTCLLGTWERTIRQVVSIQEQIDEKENMMILYEPNDFAALFPHMV
ncbi:hypothetical protein RDWZM_010542 [Blomia tropicalis]|uniref:Mediator of RNA polymerase II transcription subunit 15 n=1 Tax=Blomia tropicalis TaxID=40697 RepID=A0A9Q0M181_BLOTA|nr:hypothetical protein RDWZM_010542 [Blomia tropicalis]